MTRKTNTPAPLCFSYARFSSKQQAKGDSLERQADARDAWIRRMGLRLDDKLAMTDRGVSAFKGDNRENPDRNALAAFLEEVKAGRVPRGSFLVVENLDRLSRQHIRPALTLLLNLIDAGVRIVQLMPVEQIYDDDNLDPMQLMMAIMELSRGHGESLVKSDRVGKAWRKRKANAAATGAPISRECPAWLEVKDNKYLVRPGAVEAIRFIYKLATDGNGFAAIIKRLQKDKVSPFPGLPAWARSTVAVLLRDRRVVGEYQPRKMSGNRCKEPDGPPVPNYYPVIITEDEWAAARFALDGRRMHRGPKGRSEYLFAGLLRDAQDGSPLWRNDKGEKSGGAKLVNAKAMEGKAGPDTKYVTFPAVPFEMELIRHLKELNPADVLPGAGNKNLDQLRVKHANLSARLERIRGQMVDGDEDVTTLVSAVRDLQTKLDVVTAEIVEAERQASTPLAGAWSDYRGLCKLLEKASDEKAVRAKLRSAVRRMVEKVTCYLMGSGMTRLAAVRIDFRGGAHRDYLIAHKAKHGVSGTPAVTWSKSFAEAGLAGGLDLRDKSHLAKLRKVLESIPAEVFAAPGAVNRKEKSK